MTQAASAGEATDSKLSHAEFMTAWREGELRVDVDPRAAATLVSARLMLPFVAVAVIGLGIGLVLWGWLWTGIAVGAVGILAPRWIKRSAAGFLLERIAEDAALYEAAIESGAIQYTRTRSRLPRSPDGARSA